MLRIAFLLSVNLIVGCGIPDKSVLPYFNTPDFTPHFLNDQSEINKVISHRIDDFSLLDQNNRTITSRDIDNKIHVANFVFTSCGSICPTMTNHMKLVNDVFSNDSSVVMLSYTVTPWIDNVDRLKLYADQNLIHSRNWHFLTGKKSEIYSLARQSYFAEEDLGFTKDSTEFLHTEHFILVDRNRRIRGIYNGTLKLDIQQLIEDIKVLQEEVPK